MTNKYLMFSPTEAAKKKKNKKKKKKGVSSKGEKENEEYEEESSNKGGDSLRESDSLNILNKLNSELEKQNDIQ